MIAGYIFLLPVIIGLAYLFVPAIVQSFRLSVNNVSTNPEGGFMMEFAGLANYDRAFNIDLTFKQTLIDILTNLVINVVIILIFSFLIANIINQKFRFRGLIRALFFVPVIISTGIVAKIESSDLIASMYGAASAVSNTNAAGGSLGEILNINAMIDFYFSLGLGGSFGNAILSFVIIAIDRLYIVLISSGVQILVFLSALQSVPAALYEAAYVEGCSGWEAFWKITLPIISPYVLVNAVYTVIDAFLDPRSQMTKMINDTSFVNGNFGLGAAMTWLYFLFAALILAAVFLIISRLVFYYDA
jgi:ABC-type sugar transport system permease subunit